MTTTTGLEELRVELHEALERGTAWLEAVSAAPTTTEEWRAEAGRDAGAMRQLRTRAASSLINVALLGAFSSGKSFLLSGLQGGLKLHQGTGPDGLPAEKFVGLLPSSPVPTTACPATVAPVATGAEGPDTSGSGFLRVQFADSAEGEWEDVGNSPAPPVVAAYAMQDAEVTNRLQPHWYREVAEIEILISSFRVPAKLYDLPGFGSPNALHDAIVKQAMGQADCFIYVSHASRTLSENELDLIRALYAHFRVYRKPVLWVLTAIDLATQLDHRNVPAWQATINRNNAYLREHFTVDGRPDAEFIGEGFVPVAPAAEARAALFEAQEQTALARRQAAESRMDALRGTLETLIERGSGRYHLGKVADEARGLLGPRVSLLGERLRTERMPIDELQGRLDALAGRRRKVETVAPRLREELEQRLKEHVRRAARPFSRLAGHLHATLDAEILAADVRRPTRANQIQVAKTQALHDWIEAPEGPARIWERQLRQFKDVVTERVRAEFGAEDPAAALPGYRFDINDLTMPRPRRNRTTAQDVLQRTAAFLGISAPLVATGSWIGGAATAGLVFPPAAAVLGLSALVYMGIQHRKSRRTSLEVTQQEWIDELDAEAQQVRESFELAVGLQGMDMLDNLTDNLLRYGDELEDGMERVRERMSRPETQDQQALVDQLGSVVEEGEAVVAALRGLGAPRAAG
ncbi:dynamin family protein [Streptomyces mayteni]